MKNKKKKMHRILAIIGAIMVMCSCLIFPVAAEDPEADDFIGTTEAETTLETTQENVENEMPEANIPGMEMPGADEPGAGAAGEENGNTEEAVTPGNLTFITPENIAPGLYETGTLKLIKSWNELITEGLITINQGNITAGTYAGDGTNTMSDQLAGDLYIKKMEGVIYNFAFTGCNKLTMVYIPEGITSINNNAFSNTTSLKTIYIPKSVTTIQSYAIPYTENQLKINYNGTSEEWQKITIESGNEGIQNARFNFIPNNPSVFEELTSILTGGIGQLAAGIGSGLTNLVSNIFISTDTSGNMSLSTFGGVIVIFAGVSLAIGLSKWVTNWVTSLGAR